MDVFRATCDLPVDRLRAVAKDMQAQMRVGLAEDGHMLKMLPTFVTQLPSGSERGSWFALDLGGTNFRVLRVTLEEGGVADVTTEEVAIPVELLSGTVAQLFDFIASRVVTFAGAGAEGALGFTFSFACSQSGLDSGTLLCWTKGFALVDGPGLDVVALLREALAKHHSRLRVAVLVNDTVGTLAAAHFRDTNTAVGVILGTGTNAAYVERSARVTKWQGAPADAPRVVVNIEWGGLCVPSLPALPADQLVDASSPNVGQQALEKMIAGLYLGKISALSLLALQPQLFDGPQRDALQAGALTTPLLSSIVNDSPESVAARASLQSALGGSELSEAAFVASRDVSSLVSRRAARLAAAVLGAVLTFTEQEAETPTVAVDGGLFEHHAAFAADLRAALAEMGVPALLKLTPDGSGVGAALLAAAAA